MTDPDLLILGCAVSFIAIGGAYVYIRERFTWSQQAARRQPVRVPPAREQEERRRVA